MTDSFIGNNVAMFVILFLVCNEVPADIQFLLDASGSVGAPDFSKQKSFVANFARSFTIGPNNIRIGVTTFSSAVHPQFSLNKYNGKSALVNAIRNIPYSKGGTNTDIALKWVASNSFNKSAGDRNNAANIVIVMTDGKSRNSSLTKQEANRLHRAGIKVFAIGIGSKVVKDELKNIASSPENVFTVVSFNVLDSILSELKKSTCKGKTA